MRRLLTVGFSLFGLLPGLLKAEVGDPTLSTDHPHYPGEGVFQSAEACAKWATRDAATDHERSLALFRWILTHQWHLASPQEWNRPGAVPGANPEDSEMVVYDANRGRFSYGYGLCGTVHAWNEVYWRALGFQARRRAFPGHTNSEVFVDGGWRAFDTDMAGVVFNRDGSVAGYDDIRRDLSLIDRQTPPWPRYPFAWPGDFNAMKQGWKQVADGGHWYSMYGGGYAAHPAVVHLRRGETFTRYYGPDAFGDETRRRFWHRQPGGPARDWTFVNGGVPCHDGADSNGRGNTTYGNALFEYAPDLTSEAFREGIVAGENVAPSPRGVGGSAAGESSVTFEHFSPYVICGDPVDDRDPMTGPATDGFVIHAASSGVVQIAVSGDQGQTWHELPEGQGGDAVDATEFVKGRYGWIARISWRGKNELRSLKFVTTCQLNQAMYPRLRPGGSKVSYRAANRAVVPVMPRFEDEEATVDSFERRDLRSKNLEFRGRSPRERLAYVVRGPQPASAVFRVTARTPLMGLTAAARFSLRSPSPPGSEFSLSWAPDDKAEWRRFGHFAPPEDNEFSSGWVDGEINKLPPDLRSALVRVDLNGGGAATGLMAAEVYGLRRTLPPSATVITFGWKEAGEDREDSFHVLAGQAAAEAVVATGDSIQDRFVRISVP